MIKDSIADAIKALELGELVVYPTDTLYALGADIFNLDAINKLFVVKKRSFSQPLSIAVDAYSSIEKIAFTNDIVERVVERFLPGPLTLILYKKDVVSNLITGNLNKIAVRIPNNKIALDLLASYERPLTVTSANIHNEKTPYFINDIMIKFKGDVSVYLDDGILDGLPSTIVDLTFESPKIIRKGAICIDEILDAISL